MFIVRKFGRIAMKTPVFQISQKIVLQRDYAAVAIIESFFPKSFLLKPHPHSYACMGLVLAGKYTEILRGKSEPCLPGVMRYLPAGYPHSLRLEGSGRGVLFQIGSAVLERLSDYTVFDPKIGAIDGNTMPLSQRLISEFRHDDEGTPLTVECLVLELLVQMNRSRRLPEPNATPALLRARDLLHEHRGGRLSLTELARQVGTHPVHLSRQFHRVFHCTMSEYLRHTMVQRARSLLTESDMPLIEIGELCGFHDQSHFSRVFKTSTGLTPLAYRRQTHSGRLFCMPSRYR
jgi:AraC family transcriptional regulator